jgi:SNF2 family DNA or RNA helicase
MKYYGTIEIDGKSFVINPEPYVAIRLKSLFPKLNKYGREQTLSITPENCADLKWFLQRYPMEGPAEVDFALHEGTSAYEANLFHLNKIMLPDYVPNTDFKMTHPPYPYQAQAVEVYKRKTFLLLADDLGLGKTITAITSFMHPELLPALVVVEPHLKSQWVSQIKYFAPQLKVHTIDKGKPYPLPKAHVYIINYTLLSKWLDVLNRGWLKSIIAEEAQNLRRTESDKYKAFQKISNVTPYAMGLSATPIYNYGDEFFNVLNALREGCLGKEEEFRREWVYSGGYNDGRIKDTKAFGTYLRDQFIMLRRTEEDIDLQLPKLNNVVHEIEYNEAVLQEFKGSAIELAKKILETSYDPNKERFTAAGQFDLKLRQVTGIAKAPFVCGFVELMLKQYQNCIIYAWHRAVYDIYLEMLAHHNPVLYTGSESPKQKDKSKHLFVSGLSRILIISHRSGSGLDGLQEHCHAGIFGELDWSPQIHRQCAGRLRRPGQEKQVDMYYLIANGGSDPTISNVLGVKKEQSDGVLNPNMNIVDIQAESNRVKKLAENFLKQYQ